MRMLVLLMTSGSMVKYSTLRIPSFLKPCNPPGMFMSGATNRRWRRCRTSWTQSGASEKEDAAKSVENAFDEAMRRIDASYKECIDKLEPGRSS